MGHPENISANQTGQIEQVVRNETLRRLESIFRAYNEAGIEVQPTGALSRKVMRAVRRQLARV
jgi:hypothetical protein